MQYLVNVTKKTCNTLSIKLLQVLKVLEAGLEPARPQWSLDFKSNVSTNSTTRALSCESSALEAIHLPITIRTSNCFKKKSRLRLIGIGTLSGKRDSDPRPRPWQGRALPTELFPRFQINDLHQKFGGANVVLFLIYKNIF